MITCFLKSRLISKFSLLKKFSCYYSLTNNLELIYHELKTDYNKEENSISTANQAAGSILKLPKVEMNNLFKKISLQNATQHIPNPDFYFNFFCIIAELKRRQMRNCDYICIGQSYTLLVDILARYFANNPNFNSNSEDIKNSQSSNDSSDKKILTIDDYKKLSIRERVQINKDQFDVNSTHSVYEDIKNLLRDKINVHNNSCDFSLNENEDFLFNKYVINGFNEYLCKKILENPDIFTAIVIVRKERLDDLYEKLNEYNKNL